MIQAYHCGTCYVGATYQELESTTFRYRRWGPYQKNIYGAALALIAIIYGIMQGIIAVACLLATMHNPGNGMDPQW